MAIGPPAVDRRARGIVVPEIVARNADGPARPPVAKEFLGQRPGVVLQVIEHEDGAPLAIFDQAQSRIRRGREHGQSGLRRQIGGANLGVARYRHRKLLAEAAEQPPAAGCHAMSEDAEHLLRQPVLRHAVEVMKGRLGGPADVEAADAAGLRPVEDGTQLGPIVDVLERQCLDRRAGHDQAIERLVAHLGPAAIERGDVVGRRRLRSIRIRQAQDQLDGHRRRTEQPRDLRLRHDLGRHQVDQAHPQRTTPGPAQVIGAPDVDAFGHECRPGRQPSGKYDGHRVSPLFPRSKERQGSVASRTLSLGTGQAARATVRDAVSAWSRSAMMSSICSMPTDTRT